MTPVDYDGDDNRARSFRRSRTLPDSLIALWHAAVAEAGAQVQGPILDLGSGTGQFLEPLAEWFEAPVFAIEPSPAMRDEAAAQGLTARFPLVAARAEALPCANASFGAAWLSTVIHQFDDREAALRELRRVIRSGGVVFVRGYFADTPVTGLLSSFPGIDRASRSFPTSIDTARDFAAAGFRQLTSVDVVETWTFELSDWIGRARSLRDADSMLRQLRDDEFEAGLVAIEAEHGERPERVVSATTLRLLTFERDP